MTILDTIITEKKKEVIQLKKTRIEAVSHPAIPSLASRLRERNTMGVIAEIKRASPSKGMIHPNVDPVKQALLYEKHGASAISVLTDSAFFKGSMDDLRAVRQAVQLPILCKDFMIDRSQIDLAKSAGANIILLIAAALDDEKLHDLYHYAQSQNVEVLCEVHNEAEMERILPLEPTLVGVNNRDLKTFTVDLDITARLANMIADKDCLFISESGIVSPEDVNQVAKSGAKAVLVGETLMRSEAVDHTLESLQIPL